MGILAYAGKELNAHSASSSTLSHKIKTGHNVSMDDFSVLSQGYTPLDVLIQESLLISKTIPLLNSNIRSFPLALF